MPVQSVLSVDNFPFPTTATPLVLTAGADGGPHFYRGDCNFTGRRSGLDPVEIADGAAVISFLFAPENAPGAFADPPCMDACDANDDGRIDLADAFGILNYLFVPGADFPAAPGPGFEKSGCCSVNPTPEGTDPTDDNLGCVAGRVSCGPIGG